MKNNNNNPYVYNFKLFRVIIGILGILLPVVLWLGSGILTKGDYWIQPSISHYYYSVMHFFFVAVLILLGFFLIIYRGDNTNKHENTTSTIAGILALIVSVFPTDVSGFNGYIFIQQCFWESWFRYLHFGAAAGLFICFIIFCFYFFQKSDYDYTTPEQLLKKKRRNIIYKASGWVIVCSIVCIGLLSSVFSEFAEVHFENYVYVFEWTALWAFGNAWFVKGSEIFESIELKLINFIR